MSLADARCRYCNELLNPPGSTLTNYTPVCTDCHDRMRNGWEPWKE
jgi:formylmethanofuran dehydrogenase subunit E